MQKTLGGHPLVSATLRVHVQSASGLENGQALLLHQLRQPWHELAATYHCASDSALDNAVPDCSGGTAWTLGPEQSNPWFEGIAETLVDDSSALVEFDVTDQVAGILDGTLDHQGWVVARPEGSPGLLRLYLRESATPPELVLVSDPTDTSTSTAWIPPDPEDVAPAADLTRVEGIAERMAFLYEGESPVQIDVEMGALEPAEVGVVRGVVRARTEVGLAGVEVRVAGHPEFGMTKSRADGSFDLAANGGGPLVLEFRRAGLLDVDRRVELAWNGFVDLGTVVMIAPDPSVTTVDLDEFVLQSAVATTSYDERGVRTSVIMVRPETTVTMQVPEQGSIALTGEIHLRATEYTVGDRGPEAMPGPLSITTAYTYAAEFSVDEAEAAGATSVTFDPPVITYVDDFVGFEVGDEVPAGVWDDAAKRWIPGGNGRVLAILGENLGVLQVDLDGDATAESAQALAQVGIEAAELDELLAIHGAAPRRLWRVETPHFSAWDYNWGVAPPEEAEPPSDHPPFIDQPIEGPMCTDGSVIECENQVLGETLPIAGTGLTLHYRSSRVRGGFPYRLRIRVSGEALPPKANGISAWAEVAGQFMSQDHAPTENLVHEFVWDGNDAYGRPVQGAMPIEGPCVSYTYPAIYARSSSGSGSKFGYNGNGKYSIAVVGPKASLRRCFGRTPVGTGGSAQALGTTRKLLIGSLDAQGASDAMGGWTFANHHTYSKAASILYLGDGSQRDLGQGIPMIETYAGTHPDAGPFVDADRLAVRFGMITAIATAADGDLYVGYAGRVVVVDHDTGLVSAVVGDGTVGSSGNGGPAVAARITTPTSLDVGPDGSLYILDADNYWIRRIGPDGSIERIAGMQTAGTYAQGMGSEALLDAYFAEDDVLATARPLGGVTHASDLAVGPEGEIYYRMSLGGSYNFIRQVLADGRVRHVAGDKQANDWAGAKPFANGVGYGHPSIYFTIQAGSTAGTGLEVGSDGSLWVGQGAMARLDSTANSVHPLLDVNSGAGPLSLTPTDEVVWVDSNMSRARISTLDADAKVVLAGTGTTSGDEWGNGIPALNTTFGSTPADIEIGPDGSIYVTNRKVVRRIYLDGPGRLLGDDDIEIPSADAEQVYVFDAGGRHQSTRDARTGVTVWRFDYDAEGRLVGMRDRFNRSLSIARDAEGVAQSITSPDGLVTALEHDEAGRLSSLSDPEDSTWTLGYDARGLLTSLVDPRNYVHAFHYDDVGRLILDEDAGDGAKTLERKELERGFEVAVTTVEGQTNLHRYERQTDADVVTRRMHRRPDGLETLVVEHRDGRRETSLPDGTQITRWLAPDPGHGMVAAFPEHMRVTLPSGLAAHVYVRRELDGDTWVDQVDDDPGFASPYERRYDPSTRIATVTTPAGRIASIELDASGLPIRVTPPGVTTIELTRDAFGRVTEVEQGERHASIGFGSDGFVAQLLAHLDGVSHTTSFVRDGVGRVLAVYLPDLEQLGLGWDAEGRLIRVTPPTEVEQPDPHELSYDAYGALASYDPPDISGSTASEATSYTHDDDHRLVQVALPSGETIDVHHEASSHRLAAVSTSEGAALVPSYDAAGRVSALAGPYGDVAVSFDYDGPRVVGQHWSGPTSGSVEVDYDARGRVVGQTVAGVTIGFGHDADGLLTSAGPLTLTRSASAGWVESVEVGSIEQWLDHDEYGEVEGSGYEHAGTTVYGYALERDALGRIITQTEERGGEAEVTWSYAYDERGRLEEVERDGELYAAYAYDPNGNRRSVTTSEGSETGFVDEQDRLVEFGQCEFGHDATGAMRSRECGGGQAWAYEYDALGLLRSVTLPDGRVIAYAYDAGGRPVARYVDGQYERGWLWGSALEPVAELDAQGEVVARYVYASRGHVPDLVVRAEGSYRLVTDYRGSVVAVVDVGSGEVVESIEYGPWGEVLGHEGAQVQGFGYAGGLWDADTGLVLFGARWYDAGLGRWLSKDPARFGGGVNFYAYAANDPVSLIDRSGLAPGDAYLTRGDAIEAAANDLRKTIVEPGMPISDTNVEMGALIAYSGCIYYAVGVCVVPGLFFYTAPHRAVLGAKSNEWYPDESLCGTAPIVAELHTHPNGILGAARGDTRAAVDANRASFVVTADGGWYLPIGNYWRDVQYRDEKQWKPTTPYSDAWVPWLKDTLWTIVGEY